MKKEDLTIDGLADRLGVSRRTIFRWKAAGLLKYYKIGKIVRFRWGDILEALRSQKSQEA